MAKKAMFNWLRANSVITKGEKPKTSPPTKAAGTHRTHRRSRSEHGQGRQERRQGQGHIHGGHRSEGQGDRSEDHPESEHTGVVEKVDAGRVEQPRRIQERVAMGRAKAGHSKNHRNRAASPHPQVGGGSGWPTRPATREDRHCQIDDRAVDTPASAAPRAVLDRLDRRGDGPGRWRSRRRQSGRRRPQSSSGRFRGSALNDMLVNRTASPMSEKNREKLRGAVMA